MRKISFIQPDDWHLHLRDGDYLNRTVSDSARCFGRAIIMPNLKPPITDVKGAKEYRQRILDALPKGSQFQPLMTLYLTDQTSTDTIKAAKNSGFIYGCKLYPAGATTHSEAGVRRLEKIYTPLEMMEELELPLLIHGEVVTPNIDIFEREKYFIETILPSLLQKFPKLRIVLEHVSSKEGIEFIKSAPDNVAATITAHHLLLNRNHLLGDGIHPHYYCLPVIKTEEDRKALIAAVVSGNKKFFLGTDSAPHSKKNKESSCGCAGIYTAHAAIELYTEVFEQANSLDKLEAFASKSGADFYGLPYNTKTITLIQKPWTVSKTLQFSQEELIPLRAGEQIRWQIET